MSPRTMRLIAAITALIVLATNVFEAIGINTLNGDTYLGRVDQPIGPVQYLRTSCDTCGNGTSGSYSAAALSDCLRTV